MIRIRDLMFVLTTLAVLAVAAACSGPEEVATSDQTAGTETVYVNGLIYTQDRDLPWAESLVTKGDRIVFVGSDEDALQYAGGDGKLVDLRVASLRNVTEILALGVRSNQR